METNLEKVISEINKNTITGLNNISESLVKNEQTPVIEQQKVQPEEPKIIETEEKQINNIIGKQLDFEPEEPKKFSQVETDEEYDLKVYNDFLDKNQVKKDNRILDTSFGTQLEGHELVEDKTGESDIEDYLNVSNSLFMQYKNKQLRNKSEYYDNNFILTEKHLEGLTPQEKEAVKYSSSEDNFKQRLERNKMQTASLHKIDKDDWYVKYPLLLGTGITDVTNFIHIGGAVKFANKMRVINNTLGRVSRNVVVSGTVGAVSNVVAESVFGAQGFETDYSSAALFGFVLGGGASGVFEGLSRTVHKAKFAKALKESDDIERVVVEDKKFEFETPEGETNPRIKSKEETKEYKEIETEIEKVTQQQRDFDTRTNKLNEMKQKFEQDKLSEKDVKC